MPVIALAHRPGEFDSSDFLVFKLDSENIGWLRPTFARQLCRWPEYFHVKHHCVSFSTTLRDPLARTEALADCTHVLAREGLIPGWRNETCAVMSADGAELLFHIERAAMRRFGLTARGVNVNAYVCAGPSLNVWIARRSPRKEIDPGLLDNLVGGGIASSYSSWDTLLKECHEEAGIPHEIAINSYFNKKIWSLHSVSEGVHSEILYSYDLKLPTTFAPINKDGEVSEFYLVNPSRLLELLKRDEFNAEAGIVTLDFLNRHNLT